MPTVTPKPSDQGGITEAEAGHIREVAATGHGFAIGDVVYNNAGTWTAADASSAALAGGTNELGIVSAVADADNFTVRQEGLLTETSHGFTVGATLYLSETAGEKTETAPSATDSVVVPLGSVVDANTIKVDIDSGFVNE